jgi:GTP cyclohydrolase IB
MQDVQNHKDDRNLPIDKVGVCNLKYPIVVLDRCNDKQHTVATFSLSVDLPEEFKGTHMSRFVETLTKHHGEITFLTLPAILNELRAKLNAKSSHIEISFPYFVERVAPVTGLKALMDFDCQFTAESCNGTIDFVLQVRIPVTSLCPCSKAISEYGAHNQRGYVTISVRTRRSPHGEPELIWIEEIIEVVDISASAPIYPLLKREDERYVTMQAYDNPVFVEDIVRNVALRLRQDPRVAWFRVASLNQESIHNHDAFAEIEWLRPLST